MLTHNVKKTASGLLDSGEIKIEKNDEAPYKEYRCFLCSKNNEFSDEHQVQRHFSWRHRANIAPIEKLIEDHLVIIKEDK